jgi:hypothetical protein
MAPLDVLNDFLINMLMTFDEAFSSWRLMEHLFSVSHEVVTFEKQPVKK